MLSNQSTRTSKFITVLKTGGEYKRSDVFALHRMILKHHSDFEFYCLTDSKVMGDDIKIIPLRHNWRGWWSKIELFRLESDDLFLYMDLDTVVSGNVDHFFDLETDFSPIYNPYERLKTKIRMGSGLFLYKPNKMRRVYNKFSKIPKRYMKRYHGDQDYIESFLNLNKVSFLEDNFKDQIFSFKADLCNPPQKSKNYIGRIPDSAKIVYFHGKPRPKKMNYLDQL